MFLAAAPYFQRRFEQSDVLLRNFQSAIMSVSTVGNLGSMIVLTKLQAHANYPKRITTALVLNVVVFTLLALSTKLFVSVPVSVYFTFLLIMVAVASLATGLLQNGVFAFVTGYGREEYTQGIMAGQGVAGVLPCIAQIISVLSVAPNKDGADGVPQQSSTSAFAYFLTATVISGGALVAFFYLVSKKAQKHGFTASTSSLSEDDPDAPHARKSIPLAHLLRKLFWLASAIFVTFTLTMFFPVYTTRILSVHDPATAPRLLAPATFIPLAFLFWNAGDLIGRLGPAFPALRIVGACPVRVRSRPGRVPPALLALQCRRQGHGCWLGRVLPGGRAAAFWRDEWLCRE
jgi:equilibrative nucleoside transporter 1/2/3